MKDVSAEAIYVILGIIGTILATIIGYAFKQGRALGRLEGRFEKNDQLTNTIATFQRRRGMIGAENNGIIEATRDSVYHLTPLWRQRLRPIKEEITGWYFNEGHRLPHDELFWKMEELFGAAIVEKICRPYKLNNAECLAAVVALCRETFQTGRDDG